MLSPNASRPWQASEAGGSSQHVSCEGGVLSRLGCTLCLQLHATQLPPPLPLLLLPLVLTLFRTLLLERVGAKRQELREGCNGCEGCRSAWCSWGGRRGGGSKRAPRQTTAQVGEGH